MNKTWNKNMRIVVALALGVVLIGGGILYFYFAGRPECVAWEQENLPGIEAGKQYVYVAMGDCDSVLAIDTSTHDVAAYTKLPGRFPHGLFYDQEKQRLYVANEQSDDMDVVGLPEFMPISSVEVGEFPPDVTVTLDKILVANFKGDSVTVINRSTFEVTQTVESESATHFARSLDGQFVYVSNWDEDTVSVIDVSSGKILNVIAVGKRPNHLTFSRDGQLVYVTNYKGDSVSVIDHRSKKVIAGISIGKRPMTPIATNDALYVANIESGTISVIDIADNKVVDQIVTNGNPQHMAIAGKWLYVTNPALQQVQVIDLIQRKVVKAIFTGPSPQQIAPRYVR